MANQVEISECAGGNDQSEGAATPRPYDLLADIILTPQQLEDRGVASRDTLKYWRRKGVGPPWLRLGERSVGYSAVALQAWLESRQRRSTLDDYV